MVCARTRALNRLVRARTKQTSEQTIAIALEVRARTRAVCSDHSYSSNIYL